MALSRVRSRGISIICAAGRANAVCTKGKAPVTPIKVDQLVSGQSLDEPLYDARGNLLLQQGHVLSGTMYYSLVHGDSDTVFLGEWDPDAVARFEASRPIKSYRAVADGLVGALQIQIEQQLTTIEIDPKPDGEPFARKMNSTIKMKRDIELIDEAEEIVDSGAAFAEDVAQGYLMPENVAEAADSVADDIARMIATDRSLMLNFEALRGSSPYIYQHAVNTAALAMSLGAEMSLSDIQVKDIGIAALLQDIGMAMVPEEIINLPRKLTRLEFLDIQKHAAYSMYCVEKMRGLPFVTRLIVYQCHERLDGTGYPRRRTTLIHKFAQIVAVADVYDALISDRPWRKAWHPYHAMEHLIRESNKGKFGLDVLRALVRCLSLFPVGSYVKISTGETARVVDANGKSYDRPCVSVLLDQNEEPLRTPRYINLSEDHSVRIESISEFRDPEKPLAGLVKEGAQSSSSKRRHFQESST